MEETGLINCAAERIPAGINKTHAIRALKVSKYEQLMKNEKEFRNNSLVKDASSHLISMARSIGIRKKLFLIAFVTQMPESSNLSNVESLISIRISKFFETKRTAQRLLLKRTLTRGLISFLFGFSLFLISVAMQATLKYFELVNQYSFILQALIVAGWACVWAPLNLLLFEWWPIAYNAVLYKRMARDVKVIIQQYHPNDPYIHLLKDAEKKLLLPVRDRKRKQRYDRVIEISVDNLSQLFEQDESDLTYYPILTGGVIKYLVSKLWALNSKLRGDLLIRVLTKENDLENLTHVEHTEYSENPSLKLATIEVQKTIFETFQRKIVETRQQIKFDFIYALGGLVVGIIFFIICETIAAVFMWYSQTYSILEVFAALFNIGSWILLWAPVELLIYSWWEPLRDITQYRQLMNAHIDISIDVTSEPKL